jgi:hypothetical protein
MPGISLAISSEMIMRRLLILSFIACLFFLCGCAGHAAKTTEKGVFHVKLSSNGELLKFGRNEIILSITDAKGVNVEGAKVEITPWMPEHGHGSLWPPTITEQGKGRYRAVIALMMAGHWQLKVSISKGDIEDSTVFEFPNVKN